MKLVNPDVKSAPFVCAQLLKPVDREGWSVISATALQTLEHVKQKDRTTVQPSWCQAHASTGWLSSKVITSPKWFC